MRASVGGSIAAVIGGGIGGLAAAIGLERTGWDVTVYEASPRIRGSGGGIGITPNGLRALAALGLADAVLAVSVHQTEGGVRRRDGRWVARSDLGFIEQRFGYGLLALPRSRLVELMAGALTKPPVLGTRVTDLHPGSAHDPARIFGPAAEPDFDLVVVADGVRSAMRQLLYPSFDRYRHAGCCSWRFVGRADGDEAPAAETWGRGIRVSLLPVAADIVHCSVMASCRRDEYQAADHPSLLSEWLADWHRPLPRLVSNLRDQPLFFDDIFELEEPLPSLRVGRAVLLGDAAYPMTPNVGAANLALEDAVTLSSEAQPVSDWPTLKRRVDAYSSARLGRRRVLATLSNRMGRYALPRGRAATTFRNLSTALGGHLPTGTTARALDRVFRWSPHEPMSVARTSTRAGTPQRPSDRTPGAKP